MTDVEAREQQVIALVREAMASGAYGFSERLMEFKEFAAAGRPLTEFFYEAAESFVGIRRDLVDPLTGASPEFSRDRLKAALGVPS